MSALQTSIEKAMAIPVAIKKAIPAFDKNTIPPITDKMGKYWEQPDVQKILIDDTYALMSQQDFDKLHDYSHSQPSGVYPGKAWKSKMAVAGPKRFAWYLCWFGISDNPTRCTNNYRAILIA